MDGSGNICDRIMASGKAGKGWEVCERDLVVNIWCLVGC